MNKRIVGIILFLIVFPIVLSSVADYLWWWISGTALSSQDYYILLVVLYVACSGGVGILKEKYGKEYMQAESLARTPRNRYGWYALFIFLGLLCLEFAYLAYSTILK
jgi:hypothetical protein